jgi:hypothetical protein
MSYDPNVHLPPIEERPGCGLGLDAGPPKAPVGEPGGFDQPAPGPADTPDGKPKPPRIEEPKNPHIDPGHPPRIEEPPRPRIDPPKGPVK